MIVFTLGQFFNYQNPSQFNPKMYAISRIPRLTFGMNTKPMETMTLIQIEASAHASTTVGHFRKASDVTA